MSRTLLVLWRVIRAVALVIIVLIVTELGILFLGAYYESEAQAALESADSYFFIGEYDMASQLYSEAYELVHKEMFCVELSGAFSTLRDSRRGELLTGLQDELYAIETKRLMAECGACIEAGDHRRR